ncbi:acyltransferase family protein [Roseovarius aestuariivivens]|uniref:acyltransferase family protein n=1 Tax=Roseovarius aestuariivivens TaxID=1888910 RepID=UPI001080098E|nr:acyltransferase family protein [Roseovarius aestuariivivens]
MKYRREIDGLRTVAVVPVILFHAGITVFSGGYVGVDVFFVISGYLITTILIDGRERGTYSLWRFYERRARRILPALFVVLAACVPVAWLYMPPYLFEEFARSMAFAALFVSNVHFWENAGYFALEAELQPLLHTWSLAVEEQYYLLFPLLLMALGAFRRWRFALVFGILAAMSLALSEWGWRNYPDENFFFTFSRFWELLAGSLCAVWLYRRDMRPNEVLAGFGLALIVYAILAFDALVPFPSLYALVPVVGAMLIILFAGPSTVTARVLSLKPMVGIGLISYSAYLWHQPLFAFARILSADHPSFAVMLGLAAASLVLAWLSWRFVEQPFRNAKRPLLPRRAGVFTASIVGIAGFAAFGLAGFHSGGFQQRLDGSLTPEFRETLKSFDERSDYGGCFPGTDHVTRWAKLCEVYRPGSPTRVFGLIGDSHAMSLLTGLAPVSERFDATILGGSVPACPPLIGVTTSLGPKESDICRDAVETQIEGFKASEVDLVFLVARWSLYATDDYDAPTLDHVLWADGTEFERSPEAALEALRAGLETTTRALTEAGIEVVIVGQVPAQRVLPRQVFERVVLLGRDRERTLAMIEDSYVTAAAHERLQARAYSVLRSVERDMVTVVTLDPAFAQGDRYGWLSEGQALYVDRDHLSVAGAHVAARYLASQLEEIVPR